VDGVAQIATNPGTFHSIYSIPAADAQQGLDRLAGKRLDAIVMLGTGMPTLEPILQRPEVGGAPVISCMLCLGWASIDAVLGRKPDATELREFVRGKGWGQRLRERTVK
jgi:maleate isomerase